MAEGSRLCRVLPTPIGVFQLEEEPMQKHLLLRLLAVLLGFTLVASACGDDDSDSGEAADSSSDSSDDSADDSEDVVEATQDGSVLAAVIARGELNCGVSGAGVGFSVTQPDGSQVGFDADYCRAPLPPSSATRTP